MLKLDSYYYKKLNFSYFKVFFKPYYDNSNIKRF